MCINEPDVPVIVTFQMPVLAVGLVVNVKVLVVLSGLNGAVTPLGRPAALRLTLPVKPNRGVAVMVLKTVFP